MQVIKLKLNKSAFMWSYVVRVDIAIGYIINTL